MPSKGSTGNIRKREDPILRFNQKINKQGSCWNWTGSINNKGYGTFGLSFGWREYTQTYAHRYSYTINKGLIPKGLCVIHKCDNTKCVNPDHLFLGTMKDNTQDMISKGRDKLWGNPMYGESNPASKLNTAQVLKIKSSLDLSGTLAKRFCVSKSLIKMIKRNKIWKHVKPLEVLEKTNEPKNSVRSSK